MISYAPFWRTLKSSNKSSYSLIKYNNVSSSLINRLRNDKPINTTTLNDLCILLECQVTDIMIFIPSEDDKPIIKKDDLNSKKV